MSQLVDASGQTVSASELRVALEDVLSCYFGTQRRIAKLERRPSVYRTGFALEELNVCLSDGTAVQLMLKNLSWQALLENTRQVKPAFLYDPMREIETYRVILTPSWQGTATCYGAVVDHQAERYWLFLERVPGLRLANVGEFTTWQEACRWLALMHTHFAKETERLAQAVPLLPYDGDFYRRWMRRARAFMQRSEQAQPRDARRSIEWLAGRYDQVVERLVALPVTFIHGEFYASNVLVQETAGGLRICPIDWEMTAVGPSLIDLAALIAGSWTVEEKTSLAMAYYSALAPDGSWCSAPDAFLAALDYCRLHLAIQWLGWSREWIPPPEQAQNWLSEVLYLAERLGL